MIYLNSTLLWFYSWSSFTFFSLSYLTKNVSFPIETLIYIPTCTLYNSYTTLNMSIFDSILSCLPWCHKTCSVHSTHILFIYENMKMILWSGKQQNRIKKHFKGILCRCYAYNFVVLFVFFVLVFVKKYTQFHVVYIWIIFCTLHSV